jgi:hypothetical protein
VDDGNESVVIASAKSGKKEGRRLKIVSDEICKPTEGDARCGWFAGLSAKSILVSGLYRWAVWRGLSVDAKNNAKSVELSTDAYGNVTAVDANENATKSSAIPWTVGVGRPDMSLLPGFWGCDNKSWATFVCSDRLSLAHAEMQSHAELRGSHGNLFCFAADLATDTIEVGYANVDKFDPAKSMANGWSDMPVTWPGIRWHVPDLASCHVYVAGSEGLEAWFVPAPEPPAPPRAELISCW